MIHLVLLYFQLRLAYFLFFSSSYTTLDNFACVPAQADEQVIEVDLDRERKM